MENNDINSALKEFRSTPNAVLLDVRTPEEYKSGHIPGSVNIPLQTINNVDFDKTTHIFVYCLSGARSRRATLYLNKVGYANAKNIGGIAAYNGEREM